MQNFVSLAKKIRFALAAETLRRYLHYRVNSRIAQFSLPDRRRNEELQRLLLDTLPIKRNCSAELQNVPSKRVRNLEIMCINFSE